MAQPRVVLADDVPMSLAAFASVLRNSCDIVAMADDGCAALAAIRQFHPDLAVLDLEMPGMNGIEITRTVIREQPNLGIIICSVNIDPWIVREAASAGARGYISKARISRDLAKVVSVVSAGGTFFSDLQPATELPR